MNINDFRRIKKESKKLRLSYNINTTTTTSTSGSNPNNKSTTTTVLIDNVPHIEIDRFIPMSQLGKSECYQWII